MKYSLGWLLTSRVRPGEFLEDAESGEYLPFPSFKFSTRTALLLTYPKFYELIRNSSSTKHVCGCRTRLGSNVTVDPVCKMHGLASRWYEDARHVPAVYA